MQPKIVIAKRIRHVGDGYKTGHSRCEIPWHCHAAALVEAGMRRTPYGVR